MAVIDPFASQRGGTALGGWNQGNQGGAGRGFSAGGQSLAPKPVMPTALPTADYATKASTARSQANMLTPMSQVNPVGGLEYDKGWGQSNFQRTKQGGMYQNIAEEAARQKGFATQSSQQFANEATRQMGPDASAAAVQASKLNAERNASATRQGIGNEQQQAYTGLYDQYLGDLQSKVGANMAKFKDTDVYNMLSSAQANDPTGVAAAKLMEQWLNPVTGEIQGVKKFTEDELALAELQSQMADKYDMASKTGDAKYGSEADQLLANWERTRRDETSARDAATIEDRIKQLPSGAPVGNLYGNNYGQISEDFGALLEQGGGSAAGKLFGDAMQRARTSQGGEADSEFADMLMRIASQGEDANLGQGVVGQFGIYQDGGKIRPVLNYGGKSLDLRDYLTTEQYDRILDTAKANNMFTAWKRGVGDVTSRFM